MPHYCGQRDQRVDTAYVQSTAGEAAEFTVAIEEVVSLVLYGKFRAAGSRKEGRVR